MCSDICMYVSIVFVCVCVIRDAKLLCKFVGLKNKINASLSVLYAEYYFRLIQYTSEGG